MSDKIILRFYQPDRKYQFSSKSRGEAALADGDFFMPMLMAG
jgi:hypothetical protein